MMKHRNARLITQSIDEPLLQKKWLVLCNCIISRAAKFEEERCKTMEENLKMREASVGNIQETYEKRLKGETRQ